MPQSIHIENCPFVEKKNGSSLWDQIPVVDVRSPAEFYKGHVPGAVNIPLFDNEERALVGTTYTKAGREASVIVGLEMTGPKLAGFVKKARMIARKRKLIVYCWRGGMRSSSMGWLFEISGLDVGILKGGYKAYRAYIRQQFEKAARLALLGGMTGSGKTDILRKMEEAGEQLINLEQLACHKGSVFGPFGQDEQPTNEQFENNLYDQWRYLDFQRTIWLEDESRSIGRISIPEPLYKQMAGSRVINTILSKELRIGRLVQEYAGYNIADLKDKVTLITKKLGGDACRKTMDALDAGDFETATDLLLTYYDKAYSKGQSKRDPKNIFDLQLENDDPEQNAKKIISFYYQEVYRP